MSTDRTIEIVLEGEFDIAAVEAVELRLAAAEREAPSALVIDLSTLTFVDSSGVRVVLLADDRARAAGRGLAVRLGNGPALRVFTALGLVDKLEVLPVLPVPRDDRAPEATG